MGNRKRIERLAEAIAVTGGSQTIYGKLVEEGRRTAMQEELSTLTEITKATSIDPARLVQDLRARIHDLKGLLARQVSEARSILKTALNGSVIFQPVNINGRAGYRFCGTGSYGNLLAYSLASNDGHNGCPPPNLFVLRLQLLTNLSSPA